MFIFFSLFGNSSDDKGKQRDEFINSLAKRYKRQLFNKIYSMIYWKSKDEILYCLNGVYIAAFNNYEKLKEYDDCLMWLMNVAEKITITQNRKYARYAKHNVRIDSETQEMVHNIPDSSANIDERVVNDMVYNEYVKNNRVEEILTSLSPEERELRRLKFIENLTDAEIAAELHMPLNTAKTKIRRLKEKVEHMVYDESGRR